MRLIFIILIAINCFAGTKLVKDDQINEGTVLVGVKSVGSTVDPSAYVEIYGTSKGFLPPRLTTVQINAISSTAEGLQVHDTTVSKPKYYNGSSWSLFADSDVLTTNGDTLYYNSGYQRLGIGAEGTVLTVSSGLPVWSAAGAGNAIVTIKAETTVGSVGTASQIEAGHIYATDEGGTGTDIAYYKFANGSMTTDEEAAYTLTAHGTTDPSNANGITGSDYSAEFDGTDQYYSQVDLLDSTSTLSNGIAIDFWFKADDGQPAGVQYIFEKANVTDQDFIRAYLLTDGVITVQTEEGNNGPVALPLSTILPNGATDWYHLSIGWDTTNGIQIWLNGVLQAADTTATTLLGDGTGNDFVIASTDTPSNYFDGKIALFRVRDMALTQKDIDLANSVEIDVSGASFSTTNYMVWAQLEEDNDSNFLSQINWGDLELTRTTSELYMYGWVLDSDDSLKILGRE